MPPRKPKTEVEVQTTEDGLANNPDAVPGMTEGEGFPPPEETPAEQVERLRGLIEENVLQILREHEDRLQDLERAVVHEAYSEQLSSVPDIPRNQDPLADVSEYRPAEQEKGEVPWYQG